tara:strand:+ start:8071 stop:8703 length:633 start_codon:yes stop_codon:yes gene_type:complete
MRHKSEVLTLKTPTARLLYAWLVEPDTKYEPMWKVTFAIDADKAADTEQQLDEFLKRWKQQLKLAEPNKQWKMNEKGGTPWGYEEIEDGDEKISAFVIKAKMKVGGINEKGEAWKSNPPALYDSNARPFKEADRMTVNKCGPGTLGVGSLRVSGYEGGFGVGVKVQPEAVQIIKHVPYTRAATGYGFEAQEGGFSSEETTSQSSSSEADF